jgi:DtxR family Mn-dependent transcriptional regulator
MDWKDVHDEACRLEHAISPEVETRMQAMLGEASTCPHGHPIPGPAGRKSAAVPTRKLSTLRKAEKAVIVSIAEEKRDLLEYLAALGMLPESPVAVEQVAPFEGPLLVRVNGALYALGRDVAEKIWVRDEH